jgi:hypothetical protein
MRFCERKLGFVCLELDTSEGRRRAREHEHTPEHTMSSPASDALLHLHPLDFHLDNLPSLTPLELALVQYHGDADPVTTQRAQTLWLKRRAAAALECRRKGISPGTNVAAPPCGVHTARDGPNGKGKGRQVEVGQAGASLDSRIAPRDASRRSAAGPSTSTRRNLSTLTIPEHFKPLVQVLQGMQAEGQPSPVVNWVVAQLKALVPDIYNQSPSDIFDWNSYAAKAEQLGIIIHGNSAGKAWIALAEEAGPSSVSPATESPSSPISLIPVPYSRPTLPPFSPSSIHCSSSA